MHYWTGKCELERICGDDSWHSYKMSMQFTRSLKRSKQLEKSSWKKIIFFPKPFTVTSALESILSIKQITPKKTLCIANITHCLHSLRYVNTVITGLEKLMKEEFSKTSKKHIEMAERFWSHMKPNVRRVYDVNDSFVSADWGQVGFQGTDPSTDFRGMGILGLTQLLYMSQHRTNEAREILLESNHPRRYYPFAATGINITAFVMEMLRDHRMHASLFAELEKRVLESTSDSQEGPSGDVLLVEMGYAVAHNLYCQVYIAFASLWVERDPPNVMSFAPIFEEIKQKFRRTYAALE
jgi:hypothetical protein